MKLKNAWLEGKSEHAIAYLFAVAFLAMFVGAANEFSQTDTTREFVKWGIASVVLALLTLLLIREGMRARTKNLFRGLWKGCREAVKEGLRKFPHSIRLRRIL